MKQNLQNQHPAQHQKPFHALATETSLGRHSRKCAVCHHPDREAIEEAFVHWRSPDYIAEDFKLDDRRVLYRHAHATGLYDQRRRNYLFTIENILECGEEIELTAAAYIKAVRAYACLCDTVRWTEPATRVTHEYHVHTEPRAHEGDGSPTSTLAPPRASSAPAHEMQSARRDQPVALPSTLLPQAELENPARSAPPRAEGASPEGAPSGPGHNLSRAESSSLPQAAIPLNASSALSVHGSRAAHHAPAENQQASAPSSAGPSEQFLAAAIPILGASPDVAAQLRKAGLRDLASLAARHVSPASNRHNPELETGVSHRKQTSEAISNRHKITK